MYLFQLGRTALHWAATEGHVAVVQTLISSGASVNIQDDCVSTCICTYMVWCDRYSCMYVQQKKQQHDSKPVGLLQVLYMYMHLQQVHC